MENERVNTLALVMQGKVDLQKSVRKSFNFVGWNSRHIFCSPRDFLVDVLDELMDFIGISNSKKTAEEEKKKA
jgi:hypothetical protein